MQDIEDEILVKVNPPCIANLISINALMNCVQEVDTMHIELLDKRLLALAALKDKALEETNEHDKEDLEVKFSIQEKLTILNQAFKFFNPTKLIFFMAH